MVVRGSVWLWVCVSVCVSVMCVCVLCQRESLVAAPPQSRCEEGCSEMTPPKTQHTHSHTRDTRPRKTQETRQRETQVSDVSDRLLQLQYCMQLRDPGVKGQGQGADSLVGILALMAAVLTECDLHCHSQRLRDMAARLEGAAVEKGGEKDLFLLLKSITLSDPPKQTLNTPTVAPSGLLYPHDCSEIYRLGIKENGIYTIQPDPQQPAREAVCDMESAGGGWTVFQRRFDGQVDFNRTWQEYRDGFGTPQVEHWLGNAVLHALTATGQHSLRITLQDWHHQTRHANYENFRVSAENQRFRLTARDYHGDAGNALSYSKRYHHDGRAFSTYDQDHDRYVNGNCAHYYGAGWWYDACLAANLNGRFYRGRYAGITDGIYWGTWYILTDSRTGERYSFKSVEMKTRPRLT